jgi:hypothetical protein
LNIQPEKYWLNIGFFVREIGYIFSFSDLSDKKMLYRAKVLFFSSIDNSSGIAYWELLIYKKYLLYSLFLNHYHKKYVVQSSIRKNL